MTTMERLRTNTTRMLGYGSIMRVHFPANDLATLVLLVARLALAIYMVLFLSLAGIVYTERWSEGAHITPEMWAEHAELTRLGYVDHHHHHDEPVDAPAAPMLSFVPVLNALPEFPLALDWTPFVATVCALLFVLCITRRPRLRYAHDPYREYLPPVPLRPPITFA